MSQRHAPRAPSEIYAGRYRIGHLEPTVHGVRAYVVDDPDDGELRFVGTAPTDQEAQRLIAAARTGALAAPTSSPASSMIMISTAIALAPLAIVSGGQERCSVLGIGAAPDDAALLQELANLDADTWSKICTLLRARPQGLTFTLLDEVAQQRMVQDIRLERARRAFNAARRAPGD